VPRDVHPNKAGHAVNGDGRKPDREGRMGGGERKRRVLTAQVQACDVHKPTASMNMKWP